MLSVEALIGAVVGLAGGVLGEKVSPKTLMLLSLLGVTLGMAGLARASDWTLMWVYAVGVGVGFGLSFVASTLLLLTYFGKRANLELYSIMCLISTTAAIGPALGGWARDLLGGFSLLFDVCAGASLLMMGPIAWLRPPGALQRGGSAAIVPEPGV